MGPQITLKNGSSKHHFWFLKEPFKPGFCKWRTKNNEVVVVVVVVGAVRWNHFLNSCSCSWNSFPGVSSVLRPDDIITLRHTPPQTDAQSSRRGALIASFCLFKFLLAHIHTHTHTHTSQSPFFFFKDQNMAFIRNTFIFFFCVYALRSAAITTLGSDPVDGLANIDFWIPQKSKTLFRLQKRNATLSRRSGGRRRLKSVLLLLLLSSFMSSCWAAPWSTSSFCRQIRGESESLNDLTPLQKKADFQRFLSFFIFVFKKINLFDPETIKFPLFISDRLTQKTLRDRLTCRGVIGLSLSLSLSLSPKENTSARTFFFFFFWGA